MGLDPDGELGIRLRRADVARLFGISRARVTQLVQQGRIPVTPNGLIDPSAAAHELLKHSDSRTLQMKILAPLRERIVEAEATTLAAVTARDRALAESADLRAALRLAARCWVEAEGWLTAFLERTAELTDAVAVERAFDEAGTVALAATTAELSAAVDPYVTEVLLAADPDIFAELPEPSVNEEPERLEPAK